NAHWNADMNIIAMALEKGMRLHARGDVEIARRSTLCARIALARYPQTRAVAGAGRNPHFYRLGMRHSSIASARGAGILQFARTAATWAGKVEPHRAGHLRN